MNILVLSCKKATELIEKRSMTKLNILDRIQLKMHLSMCKACNQYSKQSEFIDLAINKAMNNKAMNNKAMKTEESTSVLKSKIIDDLKKE